MTKSDVVRARIDGELRKKIDADMKRLGITNESDYVRLMLSGEIPGLSEIKEQLDRIEKAITAK